MRSSRWYGLKETTKTYNDLPSLTDQAGAHDTDINVIVKGYLRHGQVPGAKQPPTFGEDYSQLPTDLRGFLELAKSVEAKRQTLPEKIRNWSTDELALLTPSDLAKILAPPPKPAETPKEPK